jgi:hypothetical protein
MTPLQLQLQAQGLCTRMSLPRNQPALPIFSQMHSEKITGPINKNAFGMN